MKIVQQIMAWVLILQLSGGPVLLAQPVIIQPGNPFGNQQLTGSGVENLRVSQLSPDGTEAQLTMDYNYDGFSGPVAQLLPVIGKRGQQGVSAWFGSDPVTVGRGRGTITLRVRYFNDEPGVPAAFTSDQVRILLLNQSGTAIITAAPFLKNIKWGNPGAKPEPNVKPPQFAGLDKASAEKVVRQKQEAEARAHAEAEAREKARLQAEAEVRTRRAAEEKALAEALARDEARQKALAEAARISEEKRQAEQVRLAQETARAEEQKRAEADQRARLEAAKALADANARAEAKKRAEAEAKRHEEERRLAEAKRAAEEKAQEKAREEARLRAEAEIRRLAEEKRTADAKALAEAKARKEAEDRARQEALAQAKAELEAKKLSDEKKQAEALASAATPAVVNTARPIPSTEIARDKKTRITNVDVVNRSIDRTQMTFGVEFEYKDQLSEPLLGIDVLRQNQPDVGRHFASHPAEIGKSRRNFVLFPVKFQPAGDVADQSDFSTDQVMVYLSEKSDSRRYNIYPATMLLRWRAPGSQSVASPRSGNHVEIEDFKQNDPSNGYITIKYNLLNGQGKLRARVYEGSRPDTAAYFTSNLPEVRAGSGTQIIEVSIDADAKTPSDLVRADTLAIELLDAAGQVVATTSRQATMVWARPR